MTPTIRTKCAIRGIGAVALAAVLVAGAGPARGVVTSDRAAAILYWPLLPVEEGDLGLLVDTLVQVANASDDAVDLHCFYENANSHCTNTGSVCSSPIECCQGGACGICEPGWNETDFRIRLTPRQPIGWRASEGLAEFPLDGDLLTGIGGTSNAGSRIPPVPEIPFRGALKCIVVDENDVPLDRNVVHGSATIRTAWAAAPDVARYNAVGLRAFEGNVNDDNVLVLGGDGAEYEGCPNVLALDHLFDFAGSPAVRSGTPPQVRTRLALLPCSQDLLRQVPGRAVVQYLVYNEFEQRFSTSRTVDCLQDLFLSQIDTTQPNRSIFSAGVAGTVAGQTRMTPVGDGLLGVALEVHEVSGNLERSAALQLHFQGEREESDEIVLP